MANTNFCGCGNNYPIVPGTNPAIQTWNGQAFIVADGSSINPISLPYLEQKNINSVQFFVGLTNTGQMVAATSTNPSTANIYGGASGEIVYQINTNQTGFVAAGSTGQILSSNGGASPSWLNQSSLSVGLATTASTANIAQDIAGGGVGQVVYQTGNDSTSFLPQGTAGQVLSCNGAGSLGWITNSTTSVSANNLNGGNAGYIVYQSGVNTTAFLASGTAGQILQSNGSSSPSWINQSSITSSGFSGSLNGDVTGTQSSTTVEKVNSGSIPANKTIVGTNGSGQFIDASAATLTNDTTGNAATATSAITATTANSVAIGSVTPDGLSPAVGSNAWLQKASAYTALAGDRISADTSTGAWTLTLPTSPATNTMITIADGGFSWATNNLTVAPGGANTINNLSQNFIGNVNGYCVVLFYNGITWRIFV
jgi:hypothetical protein